ncbi:S-layer homology domain-containing protein [Paenibacillus sp. WQ 127069]|uniref:S-layer homology domain-containing protein n=1 Tax=Paenibacillus baimaensis TaxID=2982185 RepID=A0ABT2UN46_9BACL|nr:S-layer homology domain-containing protein [Paenibacillus sp. WQ 127069]MCU6795282.1 S-layer homology domain-containing protein [Paenibacillus sp. WQ 127069]
MKTIGIASIASVLLLGSVAPASAQSLYANHVYPGLQAQTVADKEAELLELEYEGSDEAPADTIIKRDRAIELAKQYVAIPSGYILEGVGYQSNLYTISNSRGSWIISFSKKDQKSYGDISVTIESDTGKLLSFYINEMDTDKKLTFPPKIDLEHAKQTALDYITKTNPQEINQLLYDEDYEKSFRKPLDGNVEYPLCYLRVVNGVVFPQNYVVMTVNGEGKILSYMLQWDEQLTFQAPRNPISLGQAAEQFNKLAEPRLQYIVPNTPNGFAAPAVAYETDAFLLDAETGEALLPSGLKKEKQPKAIPASDKRITNGLPKAQKLTKEQAAAQVSSVIPLPASAKLQATDYQENTDPITGVTSFEWDLSWSVASDKKYDDSSIYATVDSSTGAVLRYSRYAFNYADSKVTSQSGTPSYDELKIKALESVKQLLPDYAHELYLDPQYGGYTQEELQQMQTFEYYFRRNINGVDIPNDSVTISFDRQTAEIQEFNSNLLTSYYPAEPPKVISVQKARDIWMSQYKVEQQYIVVDKDKEYAQQQDLTLPMAQIETKLVYNLKPIFQFRELTYLDAGTGEWRNNETNQIVHPRITDPVDLKGNWAEEALKLMLDYEALDLVDGKVQPDALITRGELVQMFITTLNGGYFPVASDYADRSASFSDVTKDSKYFPYVENAIDYNLIDRASGTFDPDAALTRSEVADLIVKALGYSNLSKVKGLFTTKATDVNELPNQGAIAIVSALDIVTLNGETFSPYEKVTRAQAATFFYNFLKAHSQLLDTPR